MPYFRISYDSYIEGEYEDKQEAIDDFLDSAEFLIKDDLTVEEYNEETERWE